MAINHRAQHESLSRLLDMVLKYVDRDPGENLGKLVNKAEKMFKNMFPAKNFDVIRNGINDPENVYRRLALSVLNDVEREDIKTMLLAVGLHAGYYGTKTVRKNREKLGCNVPWTILFDPTSACNLKCKGCWAAEYGHEQSLSLDEMRSIISQGKALGTHTYMLTGGEPLLKKKEVVTLARENPDCVFLIYTNGTLIDKQFCDDMHSAGNITLALSIEGTEQSNDFRRGEGSYKKTLEAMKLLRENRCLFGISVCYTRANIEAVTSEAFIDLMIESGVKFAWYFNYMPVGHGADRELIPVPSQRAYMYEWIRSMRNGKTGKPMFVIDFQDDAEYVGGCIAGGRNYFHINSAGDIEPCVFIHYADSNIRTDTLVQALKKPLFTAYHKNQPFNDNHLRPCPMLENPQYLRRMVNETGARSTDLLCPEDVETLCSRCDEFSLEWAPVADELWRSRVHPETHTQYYRDRKTD